MTADYTDLATLKGYLSIVTTNSDTLLSSAITAASRAIDNFCQRRFWLDATPVARTFEPDTLIDLTLPIGHDIGSTTGLVVATDPSGRGVFDDVWASTDFQLLPYNAAYASPEPQPWTALRAIGTKTFPWLINTWLTRLDRVQITAKWGWPAVPTDVGQACLIKAARLYHRKESIQGIAGVSDFGPVRLSRGEDSDVLLMLGDYRVAPVLVR